MRSIFIGERQIMGRQYCYYFLIEPGENDLERYGVKITADGDEAALRDITVSQLDIQALGALLMNFEVTPVALRDVVEDWLLRD